MTGPHYHEGDYRPTVSNGGGSPVQGESIPDRVNILVGRKRSDSALRDRFATHVRHMQAEGRMSAAEMDARIAAINDSKMMVTEGLLRTLIADLPPLPLQPSEREPEPGAWHKRAAQFTRLLNWKVVPERWRVAIYLLSITAGILVFSASIVYMVQTNPHWIGLTVSVSTLLAGIAWVVLMIILWCMDDKVGVDA